MPVQMPGVISGSQSPALDVKPGPGRTPPRVVTVRNPNTGETVKMRIENARDMQRHHGWEFVQEQKPQEKTVVEVSAPHVAADEDDVPTTSEEPNELDALRKELTTLGVEVDMRWGKRTLVERLAIARAEGDKQ